MRECIIHIGMHKTGITSIQYSLKDFEDDKFYYVKLGNPNHSVPMKCLFGMDLANYYYLKDIPPGELNLMKKDLENKLLKSIFEAGTRILTISGEGISNMDIEELSNMKEFIENHQYKKFNIIAFFRSF